MKRAFTSDTEFATDLIERCTEAALATHCARIPGFPYATAVSICTDTLHRPWMLLSGLAEHRINIERDQRASMHLIAPEAMSPMSAGRLTLIGSARREQPGQTLLGQFLARQPEWSALLSLGDFAFFVFEWTHCRAIQGFGRMTWLDETLSPISAPQASSGDGQSAS